MGTDQIMFMNDTAQCLVHSKPGGAGCEGVGRGRRQLLLSLIRTKQGHASAVRGPKPPSKETHFRPILQGWL